MQPVNSAYSIDRGFSAESIKEAPASNSFHNKIVFPVETDVEMGLKSVSPIAVRTDNIVASVEAAKEAMGEMDIHIPVVNMTDFYVAETRGKFITDLYKAMTSVGFFAVRNTGVDKNIVEKSYAESKKFFDQDISIKMQSYDPYLKGQRGFIPRENARGSVKPDKKEYCHIAREGTLPSNIWPEKESYASAEDYKQAMITLFNELERYASPLEEAIVEAINLHAEEKLPLDYLNNMTKNGDNLIRVIYYPALSKEEIANTKEPIYSAAAHTDIDVISMIPTRKGGGLQLKIKGQWLNVVVPEDAFIVNVGDMLSNITNLLFVSSEHRVKVLTPDEDTYSMPVFIHPNGSADIGPISSCIAQTGGVAKCAKGTRNEFLFERLIEIGIGGPDCVRAYFASGHIWRQAEYNRVSRDVLETGYEEGFLFPVEYEYLRNKCAK